MRKALGVREFLCMIRESFTDTSFDSLEEFGLTVQDGLGEREIESLFDTFDSLVDGGPLPCWNIKCLEFCNVQL